MTNSYVLQAMLFHNTLLPLLAGVLDGRLASMPLTQLTQVPATSVCLKPVFWRYAYKQNVIPL